MSAGWTVVLFSLFVCIYVQSGSFETLVISKSNEHGSLPQGIQGNMNRLLKKRSVSSGQIEVQSVKVDCKVTLRYAHTVMTTKVLNKANVSQEVFFEVELPKTSFITNFTMEIDGKTYTGEVKEKEKAKKQYEKAVSSGQTAGLVKASGRKMEKFSVNVNVAANSIVTFILTHEELLQRVFGKYELMIRVKPKQLVQHFEIVADIYEPQGIAFVDAYGTFITNELLPLVEKTVTDKKAHVRFSPTMDQQRTCPTCEGTLIDGDFFIKYDVNHAHDIGHIQIVNGYFVHFFAPTSLQRVPKLVAFVIDNSFSMDGNKMKQTKEAMLTILDELAEEDYFALIVFSSTYILWRQHLSKATHENVEEAKKFVRTIKPIYLTKMLAPMIHAVNMLYEEQRNGTAPQNAIPMIILLTDGSPDDYRGPKIQESIRNAIGGNFSVFSLAFGRDADYGFLDVLSKQNSGVVRRIYEDSDAPLQLKGFYEEVASPLLSDVNFHYPYNTVNSLTKSHFKQLFNGSEIMVAGQLNDIEMNNFLVEVSAQGLDNFEVKGQAIAQEWKTVFPDEDYVFGNFIERLWAYLTIQDLLDKKDKGSPDEKGNATADALKLSLKYNFVTPLTSMVVTKPESEDVLIADKLTEEQRGNPQFSSTGYSAAPVSYRYQYRAPTSHVDGDPHFFIELSQQNDALCFNIDDKPGTIFNLVRDPLTGIVVNGQTIGDKKVVPGKKVVTYFGRFGIIHERFGIKLMVSTKEISVSEEGKDAKFFWSDTATIKGTNMDLQVMKDRSLTVTLRDSVKFLIILHKVWKNHPYHQDYLGFYTLDSHLLSKRVHGLLGQFYHGVEFQVSDLFSGEDPSKPDAIMLLKGHELVVTRGWQKDFRQDVKYGENKPCWFIHNNGTGLLDGVHTDYIMSDLFKTLQ